MQTEATTAKQTEKQIALDGLLSQSISDPESLAHMLAGHVMACQRLGITNNAMCTHPGLQLIVCKLAELFEVEGVSDGGRYRAIVEKASRIAGDSQ